MTNGIMTNAAATRKGKPGRPNFSALTYIGLKIKAPRKLHNASIAETAENIAPVQSDITNKQTNKQTNTKCQLKKLLKTSLLFRVT